MSNLRDSLSDRNMEVCRPSTSHLTTSQPVRPKSSNSNNHSTKEKKTSPSKKSLKSSPAPRQNQDESKQSVKMNSDPISDLQNQCQNLSINPNRDDQQGDNQGTPKRKNAKKKERLKLNVSAQNNLPHLRNNVLNNDMPVQEYFQKFVAPMYASSSSQYFENVSHHPQYQYSPNIPVGDMFRHYGQYSPRTPNMNMPQPTNVVYSPTMHSEPTTPHYLHNAMQHPLLSKSFSRNSPHNFNLTPNKSGLEATQQGSKRTPRNRKNANEQIKDEEKKFEAYISAEKAEAGLKNSTLIEGVLRINPKQFQHSYVSSTDRSEQDILIDGMKNRNRALEADVVVVQLIDEPVNDDTNDTNKQKKGKVVFIKEKVHTRKCIGNLKLMGDRNRQKALFVPRDHRIPRLNIPFTCWPDNFYQDAKKYENTLFLAKIDDWYDPRFAVGKILFNIGQSGDMMTETKAILAQNDLDITPFGPEVKHLYPRLDYKIPDEEIEKREDCRNICIFSIDPPNCRDIDDAVSCRKLENGNYEVGVHISDVAHYLTEGTVLDEKVADKATTIYLVERAYHMLPDDLCMLCSLFPGVDKLAFSVFWEINEKAEVFNHRFSKTIINSCCQLAYDHAQAILEDREDAESIFPEFYNEFNYKDVYDVIKMLGKMSATFRQRRFDGGALRIDQAKVSFNLNANSGLPDSFWIYESKESHQLIEEFMLLANMTVANKIYNDHPDIAFLRSHPEPSGYMLKQLAKSLEPIGIQLNISSAGELHKSLLDYINSQDKGRAMVLNMLCAKPMTRARYFCAHGCPDDEFHHYALNVPLYTHFTSPIRRYADIMVHRLLAASINFREAPKWDVDKVRMIAAQCNKQKYNAKKAGEMSTELYTLKYIELHSPLVTEAVVVEVREKYIDTIVVCMGLNRRIFFNNDFPGEFKCIKNDAGLKLSKMELTWSATDSLPEVKQTIEVFSVLPVELIKGDDMVKVETKLKRPQ